MAFSFKSMISFSGVDITIFMIKKVLDSLIVNQMLCLVKKQG